MRFWPARAAFVIGAALAAPLSAQEGAPGWDVSLRGSFGRPSGSVQVRENALEELRTRPEWYRVSAAYSRRLVSFAGGGSLTAEAGLAFVLLTFKLDGTLSPATKGTETKEDFVTQELPVPPSRPATASATSRSTRSVARTTTTCDSASTRSSSRWAAFSKL